MSPSRLILLLLLVPITVTASVKPIPRYEKVDLDTRRIYELSSFPIYDYFVCIKKNDPGLLAYLQNDSLFDKTIRTVSGEMAASYYRYFNDQPEKPYVSSPSPQEKWPPSEPAPFSNNKAIKHFPYQLISKQKHDYHYSVSIYDVKKEQWRRDGEERIWLFNQFDFLKRTSDYNVESIESIDNLMLMTSLDLRSIQKANSEKNAFSLGYNNVKAFFYQADVKYCK